MESTKSESEQPFSDTEQASNTTQKAHANDTDSIPDGGRIAWLQVLGTFFIFFNTWYVVSPLSRSCPPPSSPSG